MIYTDIIRPSFVRSKNKPCYYITINDKNLVPLLLRRDGLISHNMMGKSGRLQYFYSKRTAIAFSEIFILGYTTYYSRNTYSTRLYNDSISIEIICRNTQFTIKSNIFRYPSNKTLLKGYREAFYSGLNYEELIKEYRDAYIKTYQKFYEIGKTGKIILDIDDLSPFYS